MSDYWKEFWNKSSAVKNDSYFGRVLKTKNGKPIDENQWQRMVNFLQSSLCLDSASEVLDLCCGNGSYTIPVAKMAKSVLAVDVSAPLLEELKSFNIKNIEILLTDVVELQLAQQFSHIIFMTAIQHFSEKEVLMLFEKAFAALKTGGIFYIGSIPDRLHLWDFAFTKHYETLYFENLKNDTPAVGTWFIKKDLQKMADYVGFQTVEIIDLPDYVHDSHCRFDMKLVKL